MLWGAVGVVLLIGCVNIAGLLVARGIAPRPEIAMRIALGGSRGLVVRQMLAESVVLALCGGVGGLAIGFAVSRLLASWLNAAFGVTGETGLDARVLAITSGFALLTSVAFGLLPALQATRVDLRSALVDSGGTSVAGAARSWPRQLMVAGEIALGVVLLVAAGLLVRSFGYLMGQRPGFDSTHVMTATVSLQDARYRTADGVARLFDRTLERIRTVAGVERAAAALTLPYERALNNGFRLVGSDAPGQMMNMTYVTPEYFDALRIPVVRGRVFTASDAPGAAPVIVVNQAFVRKHSPDGDPIGRQVQSGGTARTIVGVVGDVQQKVGFGGFGPVGAAPASYVPVAQISDGFVTMVHTWFSPSWIVRLSGPQEGIVRQMQQAVESVDPLLPVAKFRTLDEVRGEAVATPRAQAQLLGTLAGLALLLSAVGLYGQAASSVAERTRELGIRLGPWRDITAGHCGGGDAGARARRRRSRGRRRRGAAHGVCAASSGLGRLGGGSDHLRRGDCHRARCRGDRHAGAGPAHRASESDQGPAVAFDLDVVRTFSSAVPGRPEGLHYFGVERGERLTSGRSY